MAGICSLPLWNRDPPWGPSNTWFLVGLPTRVCSQTASWSVRPFCRARLCAQHMDHATRDVCRKGPHLRIVCGRRGLKMYEDRCTNTKCAGATAIDKRWRFWTCSQARQIVIAAELRDGHGSGLSVDWVGLNWIRLGYKFQSSSGLDLIGLGVWVQITNVIF